MFSCKITGLGDSFLEELLSVAVEKTGSEVGVPCEEIVGLLITVVKRANEVRGQKEATACLLSNVAQALRAVGWGNGQPNGQSKNYLLTLCGTYQKIAFREREHERRSPWWLDLS